MINVETLQSIKSKYDLQKLFVEELNYSPTEGSLLNTLSDKFRQETVAIEIIARQDEFKIIYCELKNLYKGSERAIVEQLSGVHPHNLVIFSNGKNEFHFTNIKTIREEKRSIEYKIKPFRRITIGPYERLRTAVERLEFLLVDNADKALQVHHKCDLAFDVEAVTREFYKDFVFYYKEFRDDLQKKNKLKQPDADDFTQTIFNRFFFLYFIQKKGYLDKDPKFLLNNLYKTGKKEYYKEFVIPLFKKLSTFNYKNKKLENIPFLNGGLFEFTEYENKLIISNDVFKTVLEELFEKYNFTVREDTEFEKEVAIDPEMMGTIFEQLILGLESKKFEDIPDPRRSTGSFYTPKFIVSFMVKQSILNDLTANINGVQRSVIKKFVFNQITDGLNDKNLNDVKERLLKLKIVDPAVGSGAYPVGILLKVVELIEIIESIINPKEVERNNYRYNLKRHIIENCIYGVDIQHRAVNLANLRLWLSLIVDLEVENIKDIPPLPNLDYHLLCGDSLVSQIAGINFDVERKAKVDPKGQNLLDKFRALKTEYLSLSELEKKQKYKKQIEACKLDLLKWFLNHLIQKEEAAIASIDSKLNLFDDDETLKQQSINFKQPHKEKIIEIEAILKQASNLSAPFNWGLDFFDVITLRGGFDIVIANPPYGVKVSDGVKEEFELKSDDSYGVFTVLGLRILRPGGTLCYIMSDTWQTIKTHKDLREILLMETDAQYLIAVPSDVFQATVNTGVYTFVKRKLPRKSFNEDAENWIFAADFSPLKINQDGRVDSSKLEVAFELLIDEKAEEGQDVGYTIYSDREMALFVYKQKIIPSFSNISYFIGSPKLFCFLNDTSNIKNPIKSSAEITNYEIEINSQKVIVFKLGEISEVVGGVKTYDNDKYVKTSANSGRYSTISENEIYRGKLTQIEKLKGIERKKDNKYFLPFDKSGKMIGEGDIILNYWKEVEFYINWSKEAINYYKKNNGLRNKHRYFQQGITYSVTGIYAPTFRIGCGFIFGQKGATIFSEIYSINTLLGILASKFARYIFKTFISHGVDVTDSMIAEFPVIYIANGEDISISKMVVNIIDNIKRNGHLKTQEDIERLDEYIYELYGCNNKDIKEIENWYYRRYPKLANAIEAKLKEKSQ